jgi:hypothetical protein
VVTTLVKYEIARAVIDGRGLLAVHVSGLNHHVRRAPDPLGFNPLQLLGVYKHAHGSFYLYADSTSQRIEI